MTYVRAALPTLFPKTPWIRLYIATLCLMTLCLMPLGSRVIAEDRAVVSLADPDWTDVLSAAVLELDRENVASGLASLQEAFEAPKGRLVIAPDRLPSTWREIPSALRAVARRRSSPLGRGRRFVRPGALAREIFRQLPKTLLGDYRTRYDGAAERLFKKSAANDDVELMTKVADAYRFSTLGRTANEVLGDRAFTAARFRDAIHRFLIALRSPRLPGEARTAIEEDERCALKLLNAARRLGGEELYQELRDEFRGRFSRRATFQEGLARIESEPLSKIERTVPAASRWGGELSVDRFPKLPARSLELSWISYAWADGSSIQSRSNVITPGLRRGARTRGFAFHLSEVREPFFPLIEDGRAWMSGVYNVYEIDSRRGKGKTLREFPKPDPSLLRRAYSFREASDSPMYGLSVYRHEETGRRMLIGRFVSDRVAYDNFMGYDVSEEIPIRSLFAIDAETGDLIWRTIPKKPSERRLKVRDARESFAPVEVPADICYSSPVVAKNGFVYALGWSEEGYVNSQLRCLEALTGKTVWERQLSSSQMEQTMFGELAREPFASFLVERDGVLYCQGNLGSVAAVRASDGEPLWAATYDVIDPVPPLGPLPELRQLVWGLNPPVLWRHVLLVAPRDSKYFVAIDTGTGPEGESSAGRILWTYNNRDGDLRDFLGVREGMIYFTGQAGVACLDARGMRADGRLATASPTKLLASGSWARGSIPSAGVLTADGVVFSDQHRLWLSDFSLRRAPIPLLDGTYPASDHGTLAGRVFVQDGLVYVTSNGLLSAFGSSEEAAR
ncbi:MAG: PQQ-binding-like beta-propeller repeat protein [Planctomycetota bacterium]